MPSLAHPETNGCAAWLEFCLSVMGSGKVSVSFSAQSQPEQEAPRVATQLGTGFIIIPLSFLIPSSPKVLVHVFTLV